MVDWAQVPVAEDDAAQRELELERSVLSPTYRQRGILGGQELGGLSGSIVGSIMGAAGGPLGVLAGSAIGAGIGGAGGELFEQGVRKEPFSGQRAAEAGIEEALWDAGGNLVFKVGGKVIKAGSSALFNKDKIPDATKAAEDFLQAQGSSLPKATLYNSGALEAIQGFVTTPTAADIFKNKEEEIRNALMSGRKEVLKSFTKSPEFETALRQGTSAQKAAGETLQSFIKGGEEALSTAVGDVYKNIFKDTRSQVTTFPLLTWAQQQLTNPAALTSGQRSILREVQGLPPNVGFETLHNIRSRWLAESRDKYGALSSEKDSRAVKTITELVKKIDESADFAASKTLDSKTLDEYKKVTKEYREGIQGLHTDAIVEALAKNPEEVGGYLFASGKETPIDNLYRAVATTQKLSGRSSKEVLDSLRYGYLEALTNTPENMLKFAEELQSNKQLQNTFNKLFDPQQKKAIEAMNAAAEKGLVKPHAFLSSTSRGTQAAYSLAQAGALGLGYAFVLSPDQQERIKDNLGETALSAGALILNQRMIARMLMDPKGAKALTYLAQAREKLVSPSAFTKLVVEPLVNLYSPSSSIDPELANMLTGGQGQSINWNRVPTE